VCWPILRSEAVFFHEYSSSSRRVNYLASMKQSKNEIAEKISPEASLGRSREEIRSITKSILDLAKARQELSLVVSRNKVLLGQGITNPEVERKLLAEMRAYAKNIELDEDLAYSLVSELIRFSKLAQSQEIYRRQIEKFLESRKIKAISIVGSGRMGSWFAKYFQGLSVDVFLYDEIPNKAREKAQDLGVGFIESLDTAIKTDLVIISIPISKTPKLIRDISKFAGSSKAPILVEISSVKNEMGLSGLLNEASNVKLPVYSIHPLFGRSAQPFDSNSLIQSFPKDTTLLRGLFPQFSIVSLDWKEHDLLMSRFLTHPHILALVFADALNIERSLWAPGLSLNGPSYLHMLELSRKVLSEDPEIYYEIQASNPYSKQAIADLMHSLLKVEKALDSRSEFVEFFEKARKKIDALDKPRVKLMTE
jgi:prephenate dehydrogenase/chorismate mutase